MSTKAKYTKADYLTIPDAPNYEINGYFKVRNKQTGKFKKKFKSKGYNNFLVTLIVADKQIKRTLKNWYRQAKEYFLGDEDWALVPSLQNKYELNWKGQLRNATTKINMKVRNIDGNIGYRPFLNKKRIWRSQKSLLNEVFGKNLKRKCPPVRCIVSKENVMNFFPTIEKAVKFLSSKVYRREGTITKKMYRRQSEIYGWQITYLGE